LKRTTDLGVGGSNPSGRANKVNSLVSILNLNSRQRVQNVSIAGSVRSENTYRLC
jgi:hypothetical protein